MLLTSNVDVSTVAGMSIAERVRSAREASGLSQRSLSTLAGLSTGAVNLIESGDRESPAAATLAGIAGVLGITLDWLVSGIGDEPKAEAIRGAAARAQSDYEAAHPAPTGTD